MRSKQEVKRFFDHEIYKNVHEIESLKSIIFDFQSHEKLLFTSAIMRSKAYMHRWLIIRAKN